MRKLLSHHEIAILLLLFNAPGQVSANEPDAIALQQEQLVRVEATRDASPRLSVTAEGVETLRRLGLT